MRQHGASSHRPSIRRSDQALALFVLYMDLVLEMDH